MLRLTADSTNGIVLCQYDGVSLRVVEWTRQNEF